MTKAVLPHMRAQKSGRIINMSSDAGVQGNAGAAVYCASKGGVVLFTKTLALDLAVDGIRVNAVCPGLILTPLVETRLAQNPRSAEKLAQIGPVAVGVTLAFGVQCMVAVAIGRDRDAVTHRRAEHARDLRVVPAGVRDAGRGIREEQRHFEIEPLRLGPRPREWTLVGQHEVEPAVDGVRKMMCRRPPPFRSRMICVLARCHETSKRS